MSDAQSEWDRQKTHRATERELQAHFAGRRGALRTAKCVDCRIVGPHGSFRARLVDLSRSGALLTVVDATFATAEEREQLMLYMSRVWHQFETGLELQIESRGVRVVADVVRVEGRSDKSDGFNDMGIRFRTELTDDECDRLGIEHADDRPAGDPAGFEVADAFDRILTSMTPSTDKSG